jgi:hypothetical protein
MLILDKQKAVERIVARTSAGAEADPEQQTAAPADIAQRLASYQQAAATSAAAATTRRPERRRRRRAITGEPAPA